MTARLSAWQKTYVLEMEPERLLEFGCPPRMAKLAAIFEEMGDEVRRDMCRRRLAGIREARGRKEVAMKKIMEATPASESTPHDATHRDTAPIYRSEELFQGKRELFIIHGGEVYRLIRTRNDRLILQK